MISHFSGLKGERKTRHSRDAELIVVGSYSWKEMVKFSGKKLYSSIFYKKEGFCLQPILFS